MKLKDLKELIAGYEQDDMEVCLPVPQHDYWKTVNSHGVISLLEQLVYTDATGRDVIIYDRDRIYYPTGAELEDMQAMKLPINELGYYSGNPVKKQLIFTY